MRKQEDDRGLYKCESTGLLYTPSEVCIFERERLAREAAATPIDPKPHPALVPSRPRKSD